MGAPPLPVHPRAAPSAHMINAHDMKPPPPPSKETNRETHAGSPPPQRVLVPVAGHIIRDATNGTLALRQWNAGPPEGVRTQGRTGAGAVMIAAARGPPMQATDGGGSPESVSPKSGGGGLGQAAAYTKAGGQGAGGGQSFP